MGSKILNLDKPAFFMMTNFSLYHLIFHLFHLKFTLLFNIIVTVILYSYYSSSEINKGMYLEIQFKINLLSIAFSYCSLHSIVTLTLC